MTFPFGRTVTLLRFTDPGYDENGDPMPATTVRIDVPGGAFAPRYSTEPTERGRHGVIVGLSWFPPPGTDVRHTDRVEIAGVAYVIEGDPGEWVSPYSGRDFGAEVALKRAVG